MSFFRIYIYLKVKYFFLSLFYQDSTSSKKIKSLLKKFTKKKETVLTGQLRVGFFLVLRYLKKKFPHKKEIVLNSYNLAEMANICKNLKLRLVFTKLNENIYLSAKDVKRKINKNTLAVVGTNIFNTSGDIKKIQMICKKNKIPFIEDNAIYFSNFSKINNSKIFSGSYGDYSLHSFNIMKLISGMYGGSVSTNDKQFINFAKEEMLRFQDFSYLKYFNQCLTYMILKLFSIKILYRIFFLRFIKQAHKTNNKFILSLIYPSLKFKKSKLSKSFFSKINPLSQEMILHQLKNIQDIDLNHVKRKQNNAYYDKLLNQLNIKNFKLINLKEPNFQNFTDYPIIVKDKKKLILYLLEQGIETKAIQYVDCQKIFGGQNKRKLNEYQEKILCLPNHSKITKIYIDYIVYKIYKFYKKN